MNISNIKFFKYTYVILIVLWGLITLHIFYRYVIEISPKIPIQGGTLVEGTQDNISFLPYTSNNNKDRIYKSFLFNGCLNNYVSGTQILYKEDLCEVQSTDKQTFKIKAKEDRVWSDGTPFSNDDIIFTYKDIIKENKWDIPGLGKYNNIDISFTGDEITVKFPVSSIDNQIFFSNYILPKHKLENSDINSYTNDFVREPITTNCGTLSKTNNDPDSIIFDLSNCDKTYIKYYQVKTFESQDSIKEYIQDNEHSILDFYIGGETYDGFKKDKVILNKFISIFFNTDSEKLPINLRQGLANDIQQAVYTGDYQQYFYKDQFLFDAKIPNNDAEKIIKSLEKKLTESREEEIDLPNYESSISFSGNTEIEVFLDKISKKDKSKSMLIAIEKDFDKVTISHNGANEYTLKSYSKGDKKAKYNISESFRNIKSGKNTYTIKGYTGRDSEEIGKLIVQYIKKPTKTITAKEDFKIKVIYYDQDSATNFIVEKIKKNFENKGLSEYFEYEKFSSSDEFEGKIQSKDYDIIIRGINMGLKKDISNLFATDNVSINPSMYKNENLAFQIKQYFITENNSILKNEIDDIYSKEVPFLMLGKIYGHINISKKLDISFPLRLYDYEFTRDFFKNIKLQYKPYIDREKTFNIKNFYNFITSH